MCNIKEFRLFTGEKILENFFDIFGNLDYNQKIPYNIDESIYWKLMRGYNNENTKYSKRITSLPR